MSANAVTYYDSDLARRALVTEFANFWRYRGLLRLLVTRDITVRYKRSTLGLWWTILNPLLTSAVLFVIFSQLFDADTEVPFVVYLLSGVLLITFFAQAVGAAGSSIVNSAAVLAKLYVPAEVFALSAVTAAATNFMLSLIPLLVAQVVTGVGIPWTVILVPIPALAMLMLAMGIGLLVASAAVFFYDVLDLTNVFIQLITYLIPTFYVMDIVPAHFRPIIYANPLYAYLEVFRGFVYRGEFADVGYFLAMMGSSIGFLILGVWVFSRNWKNLVVLL